MNLKDKLNQFVIDVQGQWVEVSDRTNIYQCYDLAALWVIALGIPKSTIQHLYAYEVYTKPNPNTKDYFDLIPNSPSFIPQDGDLAVFDKTSGNIAGHIGIALGGGSTSKFNLFSQNAPLFSSPNIASYNYNSPKLLGVLRPKKITGTDISVSSLPTIIPAVITDQTKIPQILDNNGNPMEVQQIRSAIKAKDTALKDYENKVSGLQADVEKARNDLAKYIVQQKIPHPDVEVTTTVYPKNPDLPPEPVFQAPPVFTNLIQFFKKYWK